MSNSQTTETLTISEDSANQLNSRIRVTTPFSAHGITQVQAHNSPTEYIRKSGVPGSDPQYVLAEKDTTYNE